ncbi:MAG: hypothetical protein IPK07_17935 [Deltaproteobacteria bacterium]|nr:hypothetical protein [Deltaproteobacteria bacterium]
MREGAAMCVAVTLAVLAGFAPSLRLGWWREDYAWLFGPLRIGDLLTDFANPDTLGRYRPLAKLVFAAVGALGLDARLVSRGMGLALLALGAMVLARWVARLTGDRLAGALAALFYVASPRIAVVGTWIVLWSAQLYVIFAGLALSALTPAAPASGASTRGGGVRAGVVLAALIAALGSFEVAVNLPLAAAVLAAALGVRERRAWGAIGAGALLAAGALDRPRPGTRRARQPPPKHRRDREQPGRCARPRGGALDRGGARRGVRLRAPLAAARDGRARGRARRGARPGSSVPAPDRHLPLPALLPGGRGAGGDRRGGRERARARARGAVRSPGGARRRHHGGGARRPRLGDRADRARVGDARLAGARRRARHE